MCSFFLYFPAVDNVIHEDGDIIMHGRPRKELPQNPASFAGNRDPYIGHVEGVILRCVLRQCHFLQTYLRAQSCQRIHCIGFRGNAPIPS